jgi:hypothetical protein
MGGACPILDGKAFDPIKMPGVIRDKHHAEDSTEERLWWGL